MSDMMTRGSLAGSILLLVPLLAGCELLLSRATTVEGPTRTLEAAMTQAPGGDLDAIGGDRFPDVLDAELRAQPDGTYDLVVTMSSPYDSPDRYADGWRVIDPDGGVLGTHTLLHDHADEQPFTRTHSGLVIPAGVAEVTVQGRDQANGYGGRAVTIRVPGAE